MTARSAPLVLARGWVTSEYARRFMLLGAVAIFIRFGLMPFTLHSDAYLIYSRAHEAAYQNEWFGFTSQIIIQTIHNVWLLIIRPLLPGSAGIWSDTASVLGVGASPEEYARFLDYEHLYRAIFLMKLPYVAADLACAYVLTRLVDPARRLTVAAFWLLNPLVIFASAVYGRHDSIAILMVLLSLLLVQQATDARRLIGVLMLGLAALTRFFPVLLVPLFLLAYHRSSRQLLMFLGVLTGMVGLVEIAGLVTAGESPILTMLGTYQHLEYWADARISLRYEDAIFLFPFVYGLALLWLSERGVRPTEYPAFGAAIFLLLFGLTFFHPNYAIWLVPFLALTVTTRRMLVYHGIQIVCIAIYTMQWGNWATWDLLLPVLGERVATLPNPLDVIERQMDPTIFFGFFRTALSVVSVWMAWSLLRAFPRRLPDTGLDR